MTTGADTSAKKEESKRDIPDTPAASTDPAPEKKKKRKKRKFLASSPDGTEEKRSVVAVAPAEASSAIPAAVEGQDAKNVKRGNTEDFKFYKF